MSFAKFLLCQCEIPDWRQSRASRAPCTFPVVNGATKLNLFCIIVWQICHFKWQKDIFVVSSWNKTYILLCFLTRQNGVLAERRRLPEQKLPGRDEERRFSPAVGGAVRAAALRARFHCLRKWVRSLTRPRRGRPPSPDIIRGCSPGRHMNPGFKLYTLSIIQPSSLNYSSK